MKYLITITLLVLPLNTAFAKKTYLDCSLKDKPSPLFMKVIFDDENDYVVTEYKTGYVTKVKAIVLENEIYFVQVNNGYAKVSRKINRDNLSFSEVMIERMTGNIKTRTGICSLSNDKNRKF